MNAFDYERAFRLGHSYSRLVADRLIDVGIAAELQPLEFAKDETDRERFTLYEKDIVTDAGVLEVKSSSRAFPDDPRKYPMPSLIVDTLNGFTRKVRQPVAYCMVSQVTKAIVVVPVSSHHRWFVRNLYDQKRQLNDEFLMCSRDVLRSFAELVEWLKGKAQ